MEVARLVMKKTTVYSKSKKRTLVTHAIYIVNNWQEMVAGVILWLNLLNASYALALDVIQVLNGS